MTHTNSAINQMADKNIRKWILANHVQDRLDRGQAPENVGPYIAISREAGAGGSEIARLVSRKLGWDVLDKEIVDYLASTSGTQRSLVEFVDEKHVSWIEDALASWIERQKFASTTYVRRLQQFLLLAAHHGNVVIVGRGARFILPEQRGLSVRILAPFEFRVEQVLLQQGISTVEARRVVKETDRQREAFVADHFHHKAADPHMYDLVINVEKLVVEDAANLIVDAAQCWMKESGVTISNL